MLVVPLLLLRETLMLLMPPWHVLVGQTELLKLREFSLWLVNQKNFYPLL